MHEKLSKLAVEGTPFLFYTDFTGNEIYCHSLDELVNEDIEYSLIPSIHRHNESLVKEPLPFSTYKKKFDRIIEYIKSGETYLLNFTQPTPISTQLSLKEIFDIANAPYKLRVNDQFVCFSPERFVRIENNRIFTYPMKGTIDASLPDAEAKILADKKEMAEHVMVVDLLRNDLGIVARDIAVEKFRYIDRINAGDKDLLQVSSIISGDLGENWQKRLGEIIKALLPAGSISGTPKKRTVEIINEIEGYDRGFFTGVFGVYDGKSLDSAVMIRFVEKNGDGLVYKSGGGITLDSNPVSEYQELIDKIYIP
jgi:para-aminobenzoate synthetase component 1